MQTDRSDDMRYACPLPASTEEALRHFVCRCSECREFSAALRMQVQQVQGVVCGGSGLPAVNGGQVGHDILGKQPRSARCTYYVHTVHA